METTTAELDTDEKATNMSIVTRAVALNKSRLLRAFRLELVGFVHV